MGRTNSQSNVGRPKSLSGQSKSTVQCKGSNCKFTNRDDRVKNHQKLLVLWDKDGKPASLNHPEYSKLNEVEKAHTDWFRNNGFTTKSMPINKSIASGPLDDMFFLKSKRFNQMRKKAPF